MAFSSWFSSSSCPSSSSSTAAAARNRERVARERDGGRALLQDAMRVQLESRQKRFVAAALGDDHPLVRLQDLRTVDARTRLVVREARRTMRDVASTVDARRGEMDDARTRAKVGRGAEDLVDEIAAMRDEVEDLRAVLTSSEGDEA